MLPRIGTILSKMENIVAQHMFDTTPATDLSWDDAGHEVLYPEEDDLNYSLPLYTSEGGEEKEFAEEDEDETPRSW